jgi:hypothetical protein
MDVERVAVKDDTEGRAIAWCETADDASRITAALNNDAGAVRFTDAERDRVLWWLRRPVHPGPMKDLDEAILRKLTSEAKSGAWQTCILQSGLLAIPLRMLSAHYSNGRKSGASKFGAWHRSGSWPARKE